MTTVGEIRLDCLDDDNVQRYFGYTESKPPSDRTSAMMDDETRWLLENAEPQGIYGIFACKLIDERTVDIGDERFESQVLRMHMEGSGAAAVMAITMGDAVDARISELMDQGYMAQGYILDGLASAGADCVADTIEASIKADISNGNSEFTEPGWNTTLRFSPGYAEFILENQRGIFDLIEPQKIGMSLTSSFLMKPLKSITAVIGIGPDVNTDDYPCKLCDVCNITNCKYINDTSGDR